jgi:hypothetical protein
LRARHLCRATMRNIRQTLFFPSLRNTAAIGSPADIFVHGPHLTDLTTPL